jgi:chaperonin cofactor prefoldin
MFFLGIYKELDRYRLTVQTRLDTLQSRSENLQTRLDTMQAEHCKVLRFG